MNKGFYDIICHRSRIAYGDDIDHQVSYMREMTGDLIYEVAQYYFGEGELFFSEESSEIQEQLNSDSVPWSYDCPFCDCSKRLFRVFTHLDLFYCYNCQVYGDEIGLIKQIELCSTEE